MVWCIGLGESKNVLTNLKTSGLSDFWSNLFRMKTVVVPKLRIISSWNFNPENLNLSNRNLKLEAGTRKEQFTITLFYQHWQMCSVWVQFFKTGTFLILFKAKICQLFFLIGKISLQQKASDIIKMVFISFKKLFSF